MPFHIFAAMPDLEKYETVIGLEVHTQLLTQSKLFCGDSTQFGNPPNSNVSAISLAHPGTLPVMNEKAVQLHFSEAMRAPLLSEGPSVATPLV